MATNEYKEKYSKNVDALDKLYILLEESRKGTYTDFDEKTILSSIEELNKEQDFYSRKIRKDLCDKYNKKMLLKCKQEIKNVNDDKTEVLTVGMKDETISNDITEVLTSDKKVITNEVPSDKEVLTDELTSNKEDMPSDGITEVLTEDKKLKKDELPKEEKTIKKGRFNRLKAKIASIAAAAIILIGGFGISKKMQKNQDNNTSETYTECTTEELTTEVSSFASEANLSLDEEKEKGNIEQVIKTDMDENLELKTEEAKEELEETDIKIGDTVDFENTDLYYSSTDNSPKGNTDKIKNYSYKATAISVVYQNKVVELLYNDSVSLTELEKTCKDKYGDDVKLSVNFNVVDKEGNVVSNYVGWVNSDDVKTKSKVLK